MRYLPIFATVAALGLGYGCAGLRHAAMLSDVGQKTEQLTDRTEPLEQAIDSSFHYDPEKEQEDPFYVSGLNYDFFGIRIMARWLHARTILEENLKNLDRNYKPDQPTAVAIVSTDDSDSALDFIATDFNILQNYKLLVFETNNEAEALVRIKQSARILERPIDLLYLAGHGTPISLKLGGTGHKPIMVREDLLGVEESYIDVTDEDQLRAYAEFLAPAAKIILLSCSTGKGQDAQDNLANMLARVFPGRQVYAPVMDDNLKQFILDPSGLVQNVEFLQGETYVALKL